MNYDYTASALALGGVRRHPLGTTTYYPSLASVHLAPTGGEGEAEISDYNKDGVSFLKARSCVFGSEAGYRTFVSGSIIDIKDLNLFGRIRVERLHTTVTSTRVFTTNAIPSESTRDHVHFTMSTLIVGLRIDGVDVIPEFDVELSACPTYKEFKDRIGGASDRYAPEFGVAETALQTVLNADTQPIRASYVSALHHAPTPTIGPYKGFRLPVRNFGYVHFGEMVVKPGRRRINLLRIEFDEGLNFTGDPLDQGDTVLPASTSTTGSMTILSHDSNGSPSWP